MELGSTIALPFLIRALWSKYFIVTVKLPGNNKYLFQPKLLDRYYYMIGYECVDI